MKTEASKYEKMKKSELIEALKKKEAPVVNMNNCDFAVVKWDGESLKVMDKVAEGLLNMTKLFQSQEASVEAMISVSAGDIKISGGKITSS